MELICVTQIILVRFFAGAYVERYQLTARTPSRARRGSTSVQK
jgi:hypothetical protein